jgi:UDP-GlcNAc:undecaprenyl-phosphate/decaprenyl-phosphate GlcNAc-1-phosphate transferase
MELLEKTYLIYILPPFISSLVASIIVLTGIFPVAVKIGLLDYPSKRKVHNNPRPLIGGLGILTAFFISSFLFIPLVKLEGFYAGIIMLLIVGFLDDYKNLNHRWKFIIQICAALSMIYFSNNILHNFGDLFAFGSINTGYFAIPVTVFCTIGVINAINMIDGLDGLAGGISLIGFISFAILAYINDQMELMLLSIALSGAVIGFLKYNLKSRLFMGDAGSLSLGFSLVFLSIAITQKKNTIVPPIVPLLILAVPIVDTLAVMIKRKMKGKGIFLADKNHFHHVLLRFGFNKKIAVRFLLALTAMLSFVGISGTVLHLPEYYMLLIFMLYLSFYVLSALYTKQIMLFKLNVKRNMTKGKENRFSAKAISFIEKAITMKRKGNRYKVQTPCKCLMKIKNQIIEFNLTDIASSGISGICEQSLYIGDNLTISQILFENNKEIRLKAKVEVIWSIMTEGGFKYGFRLKRLKRNCLNDWKYILDRVSYYTNIERCNMYTYDLICQTNQHVNQMETLTMCIDMNKVFKQNENVVFRKIEGVYVLLPMSTSAVDMEYIYNMNEIGSLIWEKIDGTKTFDDILGELVLEYDGIKETIQQEAAEFINDLKAAKMIEVL